MDGQPRWRSTTSSCAGSPPGVRAGQLYARDHPLVARNVDGLLAALKPLLQAAPSLTVGIVGGQFVVADTPMPKASASMGELIKRLKDHQIERISFERGVTPDRTCSGSCWRWRRNPARMTRTPNGLPPHPGGADHRRGAAEGGVASDMAAIRRLYANAVQIAESVWDAAADRREAGSAGERCRRSTDWPTP